MMGLRRFVGQRAALSSNGLVSLARIVASATTGVPPRIMGMGPVPASQKALAKAGVTIDDMDVIEINEAFAAQALACLRTLGIGDDAPHVNPNGGAIALGHPLGMSGARLVLTAAYELKRRGGRFALCTMCIGVGQGMALILRLADTTPTTKYTTPLGIIVDQFRTNNSLPSKNRHGALALRFINMRRLVILGIANLQVFALASRLVH